LFHIPHDYGAGQVGKDIYKSLESVTRVANGYASVRNVGTGELEDRMTSFFLAETCKYLYLLFDEDNFLHKGDRTYVFSTEGNALARWMPVDTGLKPACAGGFRAHLSLQSCTSTPVSKARL